MLASFALMCYAILQIIVLEEEDINYSPHYASPLILKILIGVSIFGHGLPMLFNLNKVIEILTSLLHYVYYSPTYIHILIIYSFCRIDDLTWGTKGLEGSEEI
jgi:chitin synthase